MPPCDDGLPMGTTFYRDPDQARPEEKTRLRRPDEALAAYERAVVLRPDYANALNNRAVLLEDTGRLEQAADAYAAAADAQPASAPLRHAHGLVLYRLQRIEAAIEALRCAAELAPASPEVYNDLGVLLDEADRTEEAVQAFGRALLLKPDHVGALNNQGLALHHLRHSPEALAFYDRALSLKPDYATAWFNRGDTLCTLGRFEEALTSLDHAVSIQPDDVHAWVRRGDILGYLRRIEEARTAYDRALRLDPGNECAQFHLAFPLLREGLYEEGLRLYERRWYDPLEDAMVQLPQPLWLGDTPVEGITLLLHSEQGHGDTLLMLRYAPLLACLGATVILRVQPPLETLAAAVEGASAVIPQDQPLPPFDLHIPMMSLPLAFDTRLDTVPGEPYLRAPEAERARWAERLGRARGPRVGLCWSGSARQQDDVWRSIPLERLRPLFDLGAVLYALQTEYRATDRAVLRDAPIVDLSSELVSYADTAAVMESLDLVVTVCTSTANLAGALGRPTFVLLGAVADWRWGLDPHRSPWYPSARLFRQRRIGEWEHLIAEVKAAARVWLAAGSP